LEPKYEWHIEPLQGGDDDFMQTATTTEEEEEEEEAISRNKAANWR
jgi:diadenosine tetraphosphate (Ap4A) HIT family hydrolase